MKQKMFFGFAVSLSAAFIYSSASWVYAQDKGTDAFTLEEVVVTAQKRIEDIQKVPIAMDVISGEKLAESGMMDVDEVLRNLSNVSIGMNNDGMRVKIRGLTTEALNRDEIPQESPMVAINVDGAYNSSQNAGQNMFDVERMEVLYGPQSTMYASNSPGGIVNVITNSPKLDKFEASANLEVGNYNLFAGQGMVNVPIMTDKLGLRLAAQQQKRDSYLKLAEDAVEGAKLIDENTKNARLKVRYVPTEDISIEVTGNYSQKDGAGRMTNMVTAFDYEDGNWLGEDRSTGEYVPIGPVDDPWTAGGRDGLGIPGGSHSSENRAVEDTYSIRADIEIALPIGDLTMVPHYSTAEADDAGYRDYSVTYNGPVIGTYKTQTFSDDEQKGLEARMVSKEDSFLQWIVGVNYYDMLRKKETFYGTVDPLPGYEDQIEPGLHHRDLEWEEIWVDQETKAVFGNLTVPVTDTIRANGGVRYSEDLVTNVGSAVEQEQDVPPYKEPDYKLGFEWDVADASMVYGSWATSYRINYMSGTRPPEKCNSYTLGAKNRFFDNRLQLNGALYFYKYDHAEIPVDGITNDAEWPVYEDELFYADGSPVDLDRDGIFYEHEPYIYDLFDTGGPPGWVDPSEFAQNGTFETLGVDIMAEFLLTPEDRLNLNVSWMNSEWTDAVVNCVWKKEDGSAYWEGDGRSYNGRTRANSPEWTIKAAYEHNFVLGSFGHLIPHIDLTYQTDYVLNLEIKESAWNFQESYYLLDANVQFTHASGKWSVNAYVRNATDYAVKTTAGSGVLGLNAPRTLGVIASVRY